MSAVFDLRLECEAASDRVAPYVRRTPVESSPILAGDGDRRVHLKLENLQRTGSFKLRGAVNALRQLSPEERARGVIGASSGNHGLALAEAARGAGVRALIFVPEAAARTKVAAIESLGADVRRVSGDPVEAEREARRHADATGRSFVSPYNDLRVVAGQGTVGVEIARDLGAVDVLFASMGGGGLVSGAGGYLKSVRGTRVVACSPANSAVLHESLKAGRILDLPSLPTLSDGTAGGVEEGSVTLDLCREVVDLSLTVSEEEIAAAMRLIIGHHHTLIEGSAGVAVAAYLQTRERWSGLDVAIVLCGANVDPEVLKAVL